jgi:hypothetical protein
LAHPRCTAWFWPPYSKYLATISIWLNIFRWRSHC